MNASNDMVEMKVEGLVFDPLTNTPIIILKNQTGDKSLPIWVGYPEATAIALQMETVETPRPMTHDLIINIINNVNVEIKHVCVNSLIENTFYAVILIESNEGIVKVDSRPSDAIAVALRVNAPIYVTHEVLENAKDLEINSSQQNTGDEDQFKTWLNNVKPSDFGQPD